MTSVGMVGGEKREQIVFLPFSGINGPRNVVGKTGIEVSPRSLRSESLRGYKGQMDSGR